MKYHPNKAISQAIMSVWSTPKNAENHAKQIIRKVDECKGAEE